MKIAVLDHGYVELVETWGSDERIIEAARMSTNKGFLGWGDAEKPGDERLLRHLWTHQHTSPFEMAGLQIEVKAPIFVFREWHRHRTQSYNEMSARYTPLPDENYMPSVERCMSGKASTTNKQAQGVTDYPLREEEANWFRHLCLEAYIASQRAYEYGLKCGIPKEVARVPVPVARYSRMRAQAVLLNWLKFLKLRMDLSAQQEIREYAGAVSQLVQEAFPRTWELFARDLTR